MILKRQKMNLQKAVKLLKDHNEWRREEREQIGHGLKMTDPKKLGIAIDKVVSEFENLFISGVSQQRELFLDLLRFNEEYFEKSNCEWLSEEVLDEWLKSKNCG